MLHYARLEETTMQFKLIKKVPVVEIDGKTCFVDTGFPRAAEPVLPGVQEFFGIPGLHVAGVGSLKRYTKFDYPNSEIVTSDEPIPLDGGMDVHLEVRDSGWVVKMDVRGIHTRRYIDTGAAYSYVYYLDQPPHFPIVDVVEDCGFSGKPWTAPVRRLPCEFMGYPFEILCGDAKDNPGYVPPEGVIGYDFFANFTVVVDRAGGKLTFVRN